MTHPTIQSFLDDLARQGKSPVTIRGYRADLEAFAAWVQQTYGEPFEPARIVREDVRAWRAHLLAVQRCKPATVNRRLAALRAFCRWAVAEGMLGADPTAGVPTVPQAPTPPRALESSDLRRLVRRAQAGGNPLHIAVVVLLANTGLRVSELCGLRLSDVEVTERRGRVVVRRGKGEKYREVPLNGEARRAVLEYLAVRPKVADDRLLIGRRGPLTESGVWRIVAKYAREAGVEATPHVLRHTFATRLLREAGADLVVVSDLLGHSDPRTTARYVRSSAADREEAVERL
ncbi:MAG: tyrosine-type recombinase/integrase [Thermoflexales bacterium]|nr:tyrosine-type recombinase/integrase [Thermoflexales bacterium]